MENSFKHIKGLKKLLIDINKKALDTPKDEQKFHINTGNNLIRYDTFNTLNSEKISDREKYLLQLLIIANVIRRVNIIELPEIIRKQYAENNDFRVYMYQILNVENARFDRLRDVKKDKPLNYPALCIVTSPDVANQAFKIFTPSKDNYYFSKESMNIIVDYIYKVKTATLKDITEYYLENMTKPPKLYGKRSNDINYEYWIKYVYNMIKSLGDLGYWRQFDINMKQNSKVRRNKLNNVHGSTLVLTKEKRAIKKAN